MQCKRTPMKITIDSIVCTLAIFLHKSKDCHYPWFAQNYQSSSRYLYVFQFSSGCLMVQMHLDSATRATTKDATGGGSRISIGDPSRRPESPVQNLRSFCAVPSPVAEPFALRRKIRAPFFGSHPEASVELRDKRRNRCTRVHSRVMQKGISLPRPPLSHPPLTMECIRVTGLSSLCASLRRSRRRIFYDDPLFHRTPRHQILIADSLANSQSDHFF